jgi:hypothetical protein
MFNCENVSYSQGPDLIWNSQISLVPYVKVFRSVYCHKNWDSDISSMFRTPLIIYCLRDCTCTDKWFQKDTLLDVCHDVKCINHLCHSTITIKWDPVCGNTVCGFWGFHSSVAEDSVLLGHDAASVGNRIPVFLGNVMATPSGVVTSKQTFWGHYIASNHWDATAHWQRNRILKILSTLEAEVKLV